MSIYNNEYFPYVSISNKYSSVKLIIGICSLLLASTVLITHKTGKLYPWVPIGVTVATGAILTIGLVRDRFPLKMLLVLFVLVSLTYRAYIFAFPASMMGNDPDKQVVAIMRVVKQGTTAVISSNFYDGSPFFYILGAETIILTDVPGRWAAIIYPLAIGVIFPTAIFIIIRQLQADRAAIVVGTALASIAPVSIISSITPVPQVLAMGIFIIAIFTLIHRYHIGSIRSFILLLGLLIGLIFTHKSLLFQISSIIFILLVLKILYKTSPIKSQYASVIILFAITTILVYQQWFILTEYIRSFLIQSFQVLGHRPNLVNEQIVTSESPFVELSIPYRPFRVLYNVGYSVVRLPIAGVAWLYFLIARRNSMPTQIILSGAAATVALYSVVIFMPSDHNVERLSIVAEPFLLILIGVLIPKLIMIKNIPDKNYSRISRVVGITLLAALIISSGFTANATPDAAEKPRIYLTGGEVAGKSFGVMYATGEISADSVLAYEITPPITLDRARTQEATYTDMGKELINGSFKNDNQRYIMFRPQIEVYGLQGSSRLLWDPQETLSNKYNKVYDNEATELYLSTNRTLTSDG